MRKAPHRPFAPGLGNVTGIFESRKLYWERSLPTRTRCLGGRKARCRHAQGGTTKTEFCRAL